MTNASIRVAVIDDHPVVRRGVVETFAETPDFEVIGEGATAADALAIVVQHRPDLVVLDVTLPGGGVEALEQIQDVAPGTAVMMLSIREDLATVRAALQAGARGYVSKGIDARDLVLAARKLLTGQPYVSSELVARLLEEQARSKKVSPQLNSLTAREQQIAELISMGLSNQEIASRLSLSENTIKHHVTFLMRKLGVRNRTEAALLLKSAPI